MTHDFTVYRRYVCSRCFRQLTECTCNSLPWELIQIDETIQNHIRILNENGYHTRACCEGHFSNGYADAVREIVLARDGEDIFPPLPNGFEFAKFQGTTKILYYYQTAKQSPVIEEDFEKEKESASKTLLEWVEALDNHPYMLQH